MMTRRNMRPVMVKSITAEGHGDTNNEQGSRGGSRRSSVASDVDEGFDEDEMICKPCFRAGFSCNGEIPCYGCRRRDAADQCVYVYERGDPDLVAATTTGSQHALQSQSTDDEQAQPPLQPETSLISPSQQSPDFTPNQTTRLINAALLIPGHGEPLKNHSVVIQDDKIMHVSPTSSILPPFLSLPTTNVPVLMPGLWDCHVHLLGWSSLSVSSVLLTSPALAGARLARGAHDILMSGFTSIRDLGSHALEIQPAIAEGTIPGPNIYSAGAALSQTGGHGDAFDLPSDWVQSRFGLSSDPQTTNNAEPGRSFICIADGVDEVRRAVRLQIRRGAHVIKVFASGGVLSIADDPLHQQFSDEELSTIVSEAKRQGRVVAAHCHGKEGIMAALRAGCKTIEHGTYMDEECAEMMIKKDAIYVPTRTIVKVGVDHPELMSPESYKKMLETAKHHLEAYRLAVKKGVKIVLGTDLGLSTPVDSPLALGKSGGELVYAVTEAGMTPLQAIEAATSRAPESLGSIGERLKTGRIEVGYAADLISLTTSPLENIRVFKDPRNVSHVWKGGKLMKSPNIHNTFTGQ